MVKLLQVSALFLTLASFTMGAPTSDVVVRSLAPGVESSTQFAARDAQPLLFARDDELTVRSEDLEARFLGALLRAVPKLTKLGHHAHHNNDKNKQKRSENIESRSDSESVELDRRISKALHRSNEKAKHAFQKIGGVLKGIVGL
ncbi:hypothetical protein C8J56DRAFT_1169046 [Mycena floridula]|nr:hypothetical protein C8J56DRAFT_1169046 [Mycena floridula]